jgi:cytoskeletal protein RodZ
VKLNSYPFYAFEEGILSNLDKSTMISLLSFGENAMKKNIFLMLTFLLFLAGCGQHIKSKSSKPVNPPKKQAQQQSSTDAKQTTSSTNQNPTKASSNPSQSSSSSTPDQTTANQSDGNGAVAKKTDNPSLNIKDPQFLERAAKGELSGLKIKLGASKQELLQSWGKPNKQGFTNAQYWGYANCYFFLSDNQ